MGNDRNEKNLELERLVFFSDAVVAIAITLLALDLKVVPAGAHITFADIAHAWHKFAAFFLSFIIIAVFWVNNHRFFVYIGAIDANVVLYCIAWLLFIVLVPFTSSLISADFFDKPAMLLYCINVLLVTVFQSLIWHYVTHHKHLLKDTVTENLVREYRVGCNVAIQCPACPCHYFLPATTCLHHIVYPLLHLPAWCAEVYSAVNCEARGDGENEGW